MTIPDVGDSLRCKWQKEQVDIEHRPPPNAPYLVVYLTVVLTCVFLMASDLKHLFMFFYSHMYIFSGEMSLQILYPFKKIFLVFSLLSYVL